MILPGGVAMTRVLVAACLLGAAGDASASLRILTQVLPVGRSGVPYAAELSAEGGLPPYTWEASPLPAGLVLNGARMEGTPQAPDDHRGPTLVQVTVRDRSSNDAASWTYALTVLAGEPMQFLARAAVCNDGGQFLYDETILGGTPPMAWSASGFPVGVSCEVRGADQRNLWCHGWPVQGGVFTIGVVVRDATGQAAERMLAVECVVGPPLIGPGELECAHMGEEYLQQLLGNYAELAWKRVAGELPPGLQLSPSGLIHGVPTAAPGMGYVFRVRATHASAGSAERTMAIRVARANEGCSGPDPESPRPDWDGSGGGHVEWHGGPGAPAGPGSGSGGTGGAGARVNRATSGCGCDAGDAGAGLLAGAGLVVLARRRRAHGPR